MMSVDIRPSDRFDFGYLNPSFSIVPSSSKAEGFDNSIAGIDFKANVQRNFQFYNQIVIDEFLLSEIKKEPRLVGQQMGIQLGENILMRSTYKNLDLQLEHNRVRPFTYSHRDSVANFTHYNQPLAHRWVPTLASGSS
jgi:hypothetical protein